MERRRKRELLDRILQLSRQGSSDSAIGRQLGIHRTTVKRYRESAEKEDVTKQARIQVVQEALSKHFTELCQVIENMRSQIVAPSPDYACIDDLGTHGLHSITYVERGSGVLWRTQEGMGVELCIPVESEFLFPRLRQHTKGLEFWKLFQVWKEKGGQYLLELSSFWRLIKRQAEEKTGLRILTTLDEPGLSRHFPHNIYEDACAHAFFGYTGWEGLAYEIASPKPDWFQLRQGGTTLACSSIKDEMERCLQAHQEMMEEHRSSDERALELRKAVEILGHLKELETRIAPELERLRLKRTFPGRCDVCPD